MLVSELKNCILKNIDSKHIDWKKTENFIHQLGENINDVVDEDDTFLSELYGHVRNGKDAVELTKLFLHYGYDVAANNGFNGYACLNRLCWSFYDHHILHVAEILIDAGADCGSDLSEEYEDEASSVISSIAWCSGEWMTGNYQGGNIFEAYYEMISRKIYNKPYKGIRSFRDSVGKTINKILKLSAKDSDCIGTSPNVFDGRLVFIADDVALVAEPNVEYMINPYYLDGDYIVEDVSWFYKGIIGSKIKGLRFESSSFATISFDNGKRLSFMSAYYDLEKEHRAGLCYLRDKRETLKLQSGMIISEFLFTGGWTFSDECRVYDLDNIFIKTNEKYYHLYSNGSAYSSHSLKIEEIPSAWAKRLTRTFRHINVSVETVEYIQDSLKWIEFHTQNGYLYICVDTFEKMQMYHSKKRIDDPLTGGNYTFDKNLDKIDFID